MHQLARCKKIQQTLMPRTVQDLMRLYNVNTNGQALLSTNVFMECVIERAIRDSLNDASLLYDLVNIRNDFSEVKFNKIKLKLENLIEFLSFF